MITLRCYEEMRSHDAKVSLIVFNTFVDDCSRVGDMGAAARPFVDILKVEGVPGLVTYSTLVEGYRVRGELD